MGILGIMPEQILVKALDNKSTKYCADKMRMYDALYEGGEKFDSMKKDFLPKRPIERAGEGLGGNDHYQSRIASAHYTNYAGGIIDWFSAKIVENNPRIVVGGNVRDREYWEGLNANADGRGNPLITLCRWAARETLVNLRTYFSVDFPDESSNYGRICLSDAVTVDDWDVDADGDLLWVRRHTCEEIRNASEPWVQPEEEAHYWTFYDDNQIVVYSASRKIDARQWDDGQTANLVSVVDHSFGLPMFDVRSDASLWVMDRIREPIIKLFRREASLNWYLDSLCYQMPVFNLDSPQNYTNIPVTPLGAVALNIGESASFLAPNPGGFEPNFKAVEQCKQSFYESLQVVAKEAATIPQAGRLSGDAVDAMQRPMEVLIGSFAWPIRDALSRVIEALKAYRREDNADIKLVGFDSFTDVDGEELKDIIFDGNEEREGLDAGSPGADQEEARASE